jgi:spore germination cell wall hydrolase CwlJ-like protein
VRSGERCAVFWFCAVLVIAYIGSVSAAHANQATDDKSAVDDHADAASQALIDANPQRDAEVQCLALNIYFEARSEPESGQRAVGHVVMNRVAHSGYPDSVCEVVQQGGEERLHRCQFSWWCDGQSDRPVHRKAWGEAQRLAREIYDGISKDTTDGALWYHATYVKPYWSELLLKGNKIGQHIFYLEHRRDAETL